MAVTPVDTDIKPGTAPDCVTINLTVTAEVRFSHPAMIPGIKKALQSVLEELLQIMEPDPGQIEGDYRPVIERIDPVLVWQHYGMTERAAEDALYVTGFEKPVAVTAVEASKPYRAAP